MASEKFPRSSAPDKSVRHTDMPEDTGEYIEIDPEVDALPDSRLKQLFLSIRDKVSFPFDELARVVAEHDIPERTYTLVSRVIHNLDRPVSKALMLALLLTIPTHENEWMDPEDMADAIATSADYDELADETTDESDSVLPRSSAARSKERKERKPLPLVELGRVPAGRDFVRAMEIAVRHKPWLQGKQSESADAEYQWKKQAILLWNRLIDEGRKELLRRKFQAKSFHDPQVEKALNGWLMSSDGQEALSILKKICNGKDGNPGPEYISHFLGLIIMESDGKPNLVQSDSEKAAIGLAQARPNVAAEDVHIIGDWHDPAEREKLKDPETNLRYLKGLWWDTYHQERHRQFRYATDIGYNVGEGQMISILKEFGEDRKGLNMGKVHDFHDVLDRMTFVRLYAAMKTRPFYSVTSNKMKSYADSADYALGINILSDYFSRRLGAVAQPRKERVVEKSTQEPKPTPVLETPAPRAPQEIHKPSQIPKHKAPPLPHARFRNRG